MTIAPNLHTIDIAVRFLGTLLLLLLLLPLKLIVFLLCQRLSPFHTIVALVQAAVDRDVCIVQVLVTKIHAVLLNRGILVGCRHVALLLVKAGRLTECGMLLQRVLVWSELIRGVITKSVVLSREASVCT